MEPVAFPGSNVVFAKDQPQYLQLPAHIGGPNGRVTCCWRLSWRERFAALFGGRLWQQVLTFGDPLQPQKLSAEKPEMSE